jgi:hypothetical protein
MFLILLRLILPSIGRRQTNAIAQRIKQEVQGGESITYHDTEKLSDIVHII